MSARVSGANLVQAMKDFSLEWDQVKSHWRDAKSHEFERTYLEHLPREVARAVSVIEEIDAVLRKVRSDCE